MSTEPKNVHLDEQLLERMESVGQVHGLSRDEMVGAAVQSFLRKRDFEETMSWARKELEWKAPVSDERAMELSVQAVEDYRTSRSPSPVKRSLSIATSTSPPWCLAASRFKFWRWAGVGFQVAPTIPVNAVEADLEDNKILECAEIRQDEYRHAFGLFGAPALEAPLILDGWRGGV